MMGRRSSGGAGDEVDQQKLALPEERDWTRLIPASDSEKAWGKWYYQYKAYKFAEQYLMIERKPDEERKAALIRMPTGSGKTGIMALIANYQLASSSLLIVVPSEYLTAQICDSLNYSFWINLRKQPPHGPKRAVSFVPSTLEEKLQNEEPKVFVCTTQTLAMIRPGHKRGAPGRWDGLYGRLKARISAVLVDEGHREPARTWTKAVRALDCYIILFSATPYRNDLRMFRIGSGEKYRFSLRFQTAVEACVIRTVEFHTPSNGFVKVDSHKRRKREIDVFIRELLKFYDTVLLKKKPASVDEPKVIVRCESYDSVCKVHEALLKLLRSDPNFKSRTGKSLKAIAIHEEFKRAEFDGQLAQPPKSDDPDAGATFWIHQFKLTEGIDNKDFCAVAFFEPFKNSRSLVQQIGRMLRNKSKDNRTESGYVFSDPKDELESEWKGYLSFEESPQEIVGADDIIKSIRDAQPRWYYAAGRYREGTEFTKKEILENLRIPASAHIYLRPSEFSIEDLEEAATLLSEEMEDEDMAPIQIIRLPSHSSRNGHAFVVLHCEVVQSGHLVERGFFDINLVASCIYMNREYIFHNGRLSLQNMATGPELELVDVDRLAKLIPSQDIAIKQLSLVNCDLGDGAVRRKALGGRALANSAIFLNDHLHFLSSLVFHNSRQTRHVGLQRSRIADRGLELISLQEFKNWAEEISDRLSKAHVRRHRILRRYADPVRTPRSAQARHLLLDLVDFWREFAPKDGTCDFDYFSEDFLAAACDVNSDGTFQCDIAGKQISGTIEYTRGRFRVRSDDLNKAFAPREGERRKASTFLSRVTTIQVVTESRLIYADRRFYSTARLHGKNRVHNLDLAISVKGLENITHDEKGDPGEFSIRDDGDAVSWQEGSVFHHIDRNKQLFEVCKFKPDILVCDDLGTETSDFIALDLRQKRIAILHAKVLKSKSGLSAKELQEVVGQAKKNLAFLDPAEEIDTNRGDRWDGSWKWRVRARRGLKRIRRDAYNFGSGRRIIAEIQELLHSTSVQKEVWLVLGNAFSPKSLNNVVETENDLPYHQIQLLYLLHSCNAAVAAVDARLRILTGAEKAS
jgi:superfamily II DNA or RNA helicase